MPGGVSCFGRERADPRRHEGCENMNYELFTAFVLITMVLIITPGPVVTLVIATGATHGVRAALATVLGTTIGNGILISAIAVGLSFVLKNVGELFEMLR